MPVLSPELLLKLIPPNDQQVSGIEPVEWIRRNVFGGPQIVYMQDARARRDIELEMNADSQYGINEDRGAAVWDHLRGGILIYGGHEKLPEGEEKLKRKFEASRRLSFEMIKPHAKVIGRRLISDNPKLGL